ncbi:helix-hairpin-helix domain-containing protein [Flaviaesturariibacter amylovorans]|uniref:Helix-hairpin-helix domain-containing protein n=1 Tax=Flaviaesturariibacter amylovorans TaxID=1084520 RepID=A0ABP8G9J1_9BACT
MHYLYLVLLCSILLPAAAQDLDPVRSGLEQLGDPPERSTDAEPLAQELEYLRRHPLSVNTATAEQLRALGALHELQVQSLLHYRARLGPLLAVEELQAVPHWDPALVQQLRPYLSASAAGPPPHLFRGEHRLQFLFARELERAAGYRLPGGYAGSPDRLQLRYRFQGPRLRWGLTAEKDAGEPLFRKGTGIDFLSGHLYYEGSGLLRTLALGDYTVNMGQGLIQWQGLAFGGGADLSYLKRQGPLFLPHRAAGEFAFHRGAALTLQRGSLELSAFASYRRLDPTGAETADSGRLHFTGFGESGLHRTPGERASRGRLVQWAGGGRLRYRRGRFVLAVQGIRYRFSAQMQQRKESYDLFSPQGNEWFNGSVDYAHSLGNVHFFGEWATGQGGGSALVQGLLWSGDPAWDLGLLYRRIAPRFASLGGNAFTRHSAPQNEEGLYLTLQVRPSVQWQWSVFADLYHSPWLRYRVDAPAGGADLGAGLRYRPSRRVELSLRYAWRQRMVNNGGDQPVRGVDPVRRHSARLLLRQQLPGMAVQLEGAATWGVQGGGSGMAVEGEGRLGRRWRLTLRGHLFATGDWEGRLYAWEPDVQAGAPALAVYGRGARWLALLRYEGRGGIGGSLRWAQTIRPDEPFTGSGMERVAGSRVSEIRVGAMIRL